MLTADTTQYSSIYQPLTHTQLTLPSFVLSQLDSAECKIFINHLSKDRIWISVDNKFILYTFSTEEIFIHELNSVVVSVGLVTKNSLGCDELIVIATVDELIVLGVRGNEVYLTELNSRIDTVVMDIKEVEGRILLAGRDGCLYEMEYSQKERWFKRQTEIINHSKSVLSYLVPSFIKLESSPIIQIEASTEHVALLTEDCVRVLNLSNLEYLFQLKIQEKVIYIKFVNDLLVLVTSRGSRYYYKQQSLVALKHLPTSERILNFAQYDTCYISENLFCLSGIHQSQSVFFAAAKEGTKELVHVTAGGERVWSISEYKEDNILVLSNININLYQKISLNDKITEFVLLKQDVAKLQLSYNELVQRLIMIYITKKDLTIRDYLLKNIQGSAQQDVLDVLAQLRISTVDKVDKMLSFKLNNLCELMQLLPVGEDVNVFIRKLSELVKLVLILQLKTSDNLMQLIRNNEFGKLLISGSVSNIEEVELNCSTILTKNEIKKYKSRILLSSEQIDESRIREAFQLLLDCELDEEVLKFSEVFKELGYTEASIELLVKATGGNSYYIPICVKYINDYFKNKQNVPKLFSEGNIPRILQKYPNKELIFQLYDNFYNQGLLHQLLKYSLPLMRDYLEFKQYAKAEYGLYLCLFLKNVDLNESILKMIHLAQAREYKCGIEKRIELLSLGLNLAQESKMKDEIQDLLDVGYVQYELFKVTQLPELDHEIKDVNELFIVAENNDLFEIKLKIFKICNYNDVQLIINTWMQLIDDMEEGYVIAKIREMEPPIELVECLEQTNPGNWIVDAFEGRESELASVYEQMLKQRKIGIERLEYLAKKDGDVAGKLEYFKSLV